VDEKLKSENIQKEHFSVLQNAPFCSQSFRKFFASGGKGALTPLIKIQWTFLVSVHTVSRNFVTRVSPCLSVCLCAGYLKQVYRADDFVVVCHVPELSEADLPTFSLKRKLRVQIFFSAVALIDARRVDNINGCMLAALI